ncbi:MAG: transglycosylase domain-containing protein [Desulfobacterales bacterium]|nr:transglycosylase domain-containing protein [Desulfobacterales bacterium]
MKYSVSKFGILVIIVSLSFMLFDELKTSQWQSYFFSNFAKQHTYKVDIGPSSSVINAPKGPYDIRLGYALIPDFTKRLMDNAFNIDQQVRVSSAMKQYNDFIFPIFYEKYQAGLKIFDSNNQIIFAYNYPIFIFKEFEDIPDIIIQMIAFIENREILDTEHPFINPSVEWDRLAKALIEKMIDLVVETNHVSGGSTIATQMEKFRHSEKGITVSMQEKMRQILSASMRCYLSGRITYNARKIILRDYINSLPLSAYQEYGEIIGLGDGLWVWYDMDFNKSMELLNDKDADNDPIKFKEKAQIIKQVLSLFIAHKRPTDYLNKKIGPLEEKTNQYLRLLAKAQIISNETAEIANTLPLRLRESSIPKPATDFAQRKAMNAIIPRLLNLLGVNQTYDLNRFDLAVKSTIDLPTQTLVSNGLNALKIESNIKSAGLSGQYLIGDQDPSKVVYSFSLYESTPFGNLLRVQTDNYNYSLNINEGIKLGLGSTAKLRTLIHYLEVISELYDKYHTFSKNKCIDAKNLIDSKDKLSYWVIDFLINHSGSSLMDILKASMNRNYSANPSERFFTAGGSHTFQNFNKEDNNKTLSVNEALKNSVNLIFIRLMRDIVNYHIYNNEHGTGQLLWEKNHPERKKYLIRFANFESIEFLQVFYQKYKNNSSKEMIERLMNAAKSIPRKLTVVYRSLYPDGSYEDYCAFLQQYLPELPQVENLQHKLFEQYDSKKWSLSERGYLAGIHPLELWLVHYLINHPESNFNLIKEASLPVALDVYQWLFKTSIKNKQDIRIKTILEMEAFVEIHKAWKRLGYSFGSLVPSYATALGASSDRPAGLAELIGIIINKGYYSPSYRIKDLHFAEKTPYEVKFKKNEPTNMVLAPEIADIVYDALLKVVEEGTARRAYKSFKTPDGKYIQVGGKTGTGDNRFEVYGWGGKLISSKVTNRTATFVFYIGDRFFGAITAIVLGNDAQDYKFTSALPVAVLKYLSPSLMPLITKSNI